MANEERVKIEKVGSELKRRTGTEKAKIVVSISFQVLLVVAGVFAVYGGDWSSLALVVITFGLTFLPSYLARKVKISFPNAFEILALLFIFAAIFLGELADFYYRVWWWDLMLHALFGVVIGAVGFNIVYSLSRTRVRMNAIYIVFFSASFAISIGVLWEIFEFVMDTLFGLEMMKSGLNDTMTDLMIEAVAAFWVAFFAYFWVRRRERLVLNNKEPEE